MLSLAAGAASLRWNALDIVVVRCCFSAMAIFAAARSLRHCGRDDMVAPYGQLVFIRPVAGQLLNESVGLRRNSTLIFQTTDQGWCQSMMCSGQAPFT